MTQTDWILMSVLLNIGQAFIIYSFLKENSKLRNSLKDIAKKAQEALGPEKKKKEPPKKVEKPDFWKIR